MTVSDEYRRRAGECLLFTHYVTSDRTRQLLVEMARSWHDLAERADQQKPSVAATSDQPPEKSSDKT